MVRKMWDKVEGICGKAAGVVSKVACAVVVTVFGANAAMAAESVTIPEMPVDFADLASKGAVVMGAVITGVAGIFILNALVRMGFNWIRRAFAG